MFLDKYLYCRCEAGLVAMALSTSRIFSCNEVGEHVKRLHAERVVCLAVELNAWWREQTEWDSKPCVSLDHVATDEVRQHDWLCSECGRELANIVFLFSDVIDVKKPAFCFHCLDQAAGLDVKKLGKFYRFKAPRDLKDSLIEAYNQALNVVKEQKK